MQDTESRHQESQVARDCALSARATRQDRQARVGILRNPASPPRPPARRAPLMGRWLNLRSSRRPAGAQVAAAAEAVVTAFAGDRAGPRPAMPVRRAADGSVQSIDIAGLMASVENLAGKGPVRTAFAASMRADGDAAGVSPAARPAARKPPILSAEASSDEQAEDDDALAAAFRAGAGPVVPQKPARRGSRALRLISIGLALAAVALILLPAWGSLLPA